MIKLQDYIDHDLAKLVEFDNVSVSDVINLQLIRTNKELIQIFTEEITAVKELDLRGDNEG